MNEISNYICSISNDDAKKIYDSLTSGEIDVEALIKLLKQKHLDYEKIKIYILQKISQIEEDQKIVQDDVDDTVDIITSSEQILLSAHRKYKSEIKMV